MDNINYGNTSWLRWFLRHHSSKDSSIKTKVVPLYLCQAEQENPSPEEQRAEVSTPYPQGSSAAEDYIDGYLDYQNAAVQPEVPQCRGDRSSYYGQGWQASAQQR